MPQVNLLIVKYMENHKTPTPHNAAKYGDIAKTVIMSGDPLRAKMIADNYLTDAVLYNEVRGMLGYTGTRDGKVYSVQGHGMGIPSIGIYTYELFHFYDCDTIIRLGTCGGIDPDVKVGTVILAESAVTDSTYGYQYNLPSDYVAKATPELIEAAAESAKKLGIDCLRGKVFSSDVFYNDVQKELEWVKDGVLGVEMEAYALYTNAFEAGKRALTILTVSDNIATGEALSALDRQLTLKNMIEIAFGMKL